MGMWRHKWRYLKCRYTEGCTGKLVQKGVRGLNVNVCTGGVCNECRGTL